MLQLPSTETATILSAISMVLGLLFFLTTVFLLVNRRFTDKTRLIHGTIGVFILTFVSINLFYGLYHLPNERWNLIEQAYDIEITENNVNNREGDQVTHDITYNDGRTIYQGEVVIENNIATLYSSETNEAVPLAPE